jgi:hypothetical protein
LSIAPTRAPPTPTPHPPPPPTQPKHTHTHSHTTLEHPLNPHPTPNPAATALIAHKVAADTTIGAEVVRDLAAGTTTFATGERAAASAAGLPACGPAACSALGQVAVQCGLHTAALQLLPSCPAAAAALPAGSKQLSLPHAARAPLPPPGVSKVLEGGSLAKVKLDNAGIVSVLYEQVGLGGGQAGLGLAGEGGGGGRAREVERRAPGGRRASHGGWRHGCPHRADSVAVALLRRQPCTRVHPCRCRDCVKGALAPRMAWLCRRSSRPGRAWRSAASSTRST